MPKLSVFARALDTAGFIGGLIVEEFERAWLGNRNGLRFGKDATVTSSSAFPIKNTENGSSGSVEVWL